MNLAAVFSAFSTVRCGWRHHLALGTMIAWLGALAGCAVGPNFQRPIVKTTDQYLPESLAVPAEGEPRVVMGRDIPFAWWESLGSPALNRLVARALANNPTLAAADAALREAQEYAKAQGGFFYPTVGVGQTVQRQRWANDSGQTPGLYNLYTAQAVVSYTPDVFGANRRAFESLAAAAEQARFQREATYVSLVNNVVSAAVQAASLRDQAQAAHQWVLDAERAVAILRDQSRVGFATGIDVATEEQALGQAIAVTVALDAQYRQTLDLLQASCGRLPTDALDETITLADLHLPAELPVSLPATLLEQRPDVRAAEAALHAATAKVGVAVAARLPEFSITATRGGLAEQFSQMFGVGSAFWGATSAVSQTVFAGGTLLHQQRAAEQGLAQAEAQYRSTVIGAFQNVADTLYAIDADARALAATRAAETAARRILDLTLAQHAVGYRDELAVLAARATVQQAAITRLQAETNRYGDIAALMQALGGGWWHAAAVATPSS